MAKTPFAGDVSDNVVEHAAEPAGLTRREVVFGAGALFGATALASRPLWRKTAATVARTTAPAVGIVVPPSQRYPLMLEQLVAGVRSGLAAGGQKGTPVFSRTAHNSAPSGVAAAARDLVVRDKVNTVLVYANPTRTAELDALAAETGAAIVVVDPGAHIVTSSDVSKRALAHSLGHWQSVWMLGAWAAKSAGARVHVITSMYDSGFDTINAFAHGLESSGGKLLGTSLTHKEKGDVAVAVREAAVSGASVIFVAASGEEASEIFRALAADARTSRIPLLLPGLAVAQLAGITGLTGHTALTWPAGRTSPFQMLGADVGALVAAAVEGGTRAVAKGSVAHSGARGAITVDLAKGRTDLPVRIHSITSGAGAATLKPLRMSSRTSKATVLADEIVPELRTGWLDVYGGAQ